MSNCFVAEELNVIYEDYGEGEEDFFIQAHCEIGREGDPGGEAVVIEIVGAKRLASLIDEAGVPVWGNRYIISKGFDKTKILQIIQMILNTLSCSTWDELQLELTKHFTWV